MKKRRENRQCVQKLEYERALCIVGEPIFAILACQLVSHSESNKKSKVNSSSHVLKTYERWDGKPNNRRGES